MKKDFAVSVDLNEDEIAAKIEGEIENEIISRIERKLITRRTKRVYGDNIRIGEIYEEMVHEFLDKHMAAIINKLKDEIVERTVETLCKSIRASRVFQEKIIPVALEEKTDTQKRKK